MEPDLSLGQALRANTEALSDAAAANLWQPGMHDMLYRAGWSLGQAGLVTQARDYYQRLHTSANNYLGPDHPDTLQAHMFLARWRGQCGDPAGAAAALEELLARTHRLFGPDHSGTLNVRHRHAYWSGKAGAPAEAAAAFKEMLLDCQRVLGIDDPFTLRVRRNLAHWRGEAGDCGSAAGSDSQRRSSARPAGVIE